MTIDLKALRALCDAATPGPWDSDNSGVWTTHPDGFGGPVLRALSENLRAEHPEGIGTVGDSYPRGINSPTESLAFVAAARTALPAALDEVERLTTEVEQLRYGLENSGELLAEAKAQVAALAPLARLGLWALEESREGVRKDINGGDVQDEAVRVGVIQAVEVTEPCHPVTAVPKAPVLRDDAYGARRTP